MWWPPIPHDLPPKFSFQDFFKTILCFAKTFGLFPDTRPHLIYNPKKESLLGKSSKDCLKMPLYGFVSFLLMQSLSGISVSWPRVEHAIAQWASVSIVVFTYILLLFGCMRFAFFFAFCFLMNAGSLPSLLCPSPCHWFLSHSTRILTLETESKSRRSCVSVCVSGKTSLLFRCESIS